MRTNTRSTRTLAAVSLTAALGLGLAACQDDVTSTSGTSSSAAQPSSSAPAQSTSSSPTPTASSPEAASSGTDATATGQLSRVTFSLPEGFKVFDRQELVNETDLAELSRITGVPAAQLRLPNQSMDLNAVSLQKESGGTSNILLFGGSRAESIPDESQAKALIAETGSTYVGYHTAATSLGKAAVVESTDPSKSGGTLTHVDIFLPPQGTTTAQMTITTVTAKRANEIADLITSTVKAAA